MASRRGASEWQRKLLLTVAVFSGACTCGKKKGPPPIDYSALLKALPSAPNARPLSLVPSNVDAVFASSDAKGTYDALLASSLGKALVQGKLIESTELSNQIEELMSMSHELAQASDKPLLASKLADALVGPVALGVTIPGSDDGPVHFVVAKAVESTQESVVKLAVMAASVKVGGEVTQVDESGAKLTHIARPGHSLWVAAFQNVVIASDDEKLARAALALALGKSTTSAPTPTPTPAPAPAPTPAPIASASIESTVPELKEEGATLTGTQALMMWRFPSKSVVQTVFGLSQGIARLELGSKPVLKLRGERFEASEPRPATGQSFVPKEALIYTALGTLDAKGLSTRLAGNAERVPESFSLPNEVTAALSGEAFYALLGVEETDLHHLFGLAVQDAAPVKKDFEQLFQGWAGEEGRALSALSGVDARCKTKGSFCLALVKNELLFSNDEKGLTNAVQAAQGSHPALTDVKGFSQVAQNGQKRYLAIYLDTAGVADAALGFLRATAAHHEQAFDPDDVAESVEPLCQALKTLPGLGGGADSNGKSVTGEVRPLD
jgi:hypothetical protein